MTWIIVALVAIIWGCGLALAMGMCKAAGD